MRTLLLFFVLLVFAESQTYAEMAPQPLEILVVENELIILAKVESVSQSGGAEVYATARVNEAWKGMPRNTIEFLAEAAWSCDISDAHAGETVLLFLTRGKPSRSYLISASGGGRMPLRSVHGKQYVDISGYVILPKGVQVSEGPPTENHVRLVELALLQQRVAGMLRAFDDGRRDAERDVGEGRLSLESAGEPPSPWKTECTRLLDERYQIRVKEAAGSSEDYEVSCHAYGYNEVAKAEIRRRFGRYVAQETSDEVQKHLAEVRGE